MIDHGRWNVIGVQVDALDYEATVDRVVTAASEGRPLAVSAAASHAVMTGHADPEQRFRLNRLDALVPDGQPVRHALRLLHGIRLKDRVRGVDLMLELSARASTLGLPIFLFGSTQEVVHRLRSSLMERFPDVRIAGLEPSRFRRLSVSERDDLAARIAGSGARIVFVGLGCPRQEVWIYEMRDLLPMPLVGLGAAFDFNAGTLPQAPRWMQEYSLEWSYRLFREPRRLWRRYLGLGPRFIVLVLAQKLRLRRFDARGKEPSGELRLG